MKKAYIARHSATRPQGKMGKNWGKSGIDTAGWWSRWLLWNLPTFQTMISRKDFCKRNKRGKSLTMTSRKDFCKRNKRGKKTLKTSNQGISYIE